METREVRRRNFELLVSTFDLKKDFAARIKKNPSQVSQWLSGYRTIDEETAREIERLLHKPRHWLDVLQVDIHPALGERPPLHVNRPPKWESSQSELPH